MITIDNPAVLLLAVPLAAFTIWIWRVPGGRHAVASVSTRRNRLALGLRLALLAAALLALSGAGLHLPQSREAVVFVGDLSASDDRSQTAIQSWIDAAIRQRKTADRAGVVAVGRQALVELPVSPLSSFDGFQTSVNQNYTNLQGGLELAGAIMPDGCRRRVIAVTDGQQNVGDALSEARLLHSLGARVDVLPVHVSTGPEVLVDSVDVPSQLHARERFSITVALQSTVDTSTGLTILRDRTLAISTQEPVHVGRNVYTFDQPPLPEGFHSFSVHITPVVDTEAANNRGAAFSLVHGAPHVLVIAAQRAEASNVLASLRSTGIHADLQTPSEILPTLGYLQRYAAIVIVDTPADLLDPELLSQLVPYVRDLGHGLLVIGGRESYGMGGYGQTPLEQALPVRMDLPKRRDLPTAAVGLVVESLEEDTQVNISKQAGKGVVNLLTQQDQIAVNDGTSDGTFVVHLEHVVDKAAIDRAIDQMQPADPMSYVPDLLSTYQALQRTHAQVKHIILLGDGDAEDSTYASVLKRIRAGGVTVSTVATNGLGFNDFQTMRNIARWGGGRYYRGDNPAAIPNIFLREARTVARSGIVEGEFYPQELSANPMLRDIHGVPPLFGYVATTPKPTGEMVLVSKKLDPVLAAWQFGLGRSVAWTSDASGLWTRSWLQAPGANRFWANLVSWTLPAGQGSRLFISTSSAQGQGEITVDTPPTLGANPEVTAHVLAPDLTASNLVLQPSAPGRYHGSFLANAEGAYYVTIQARGAGHGAAGQTGLAVPYSAEFRSTGTNTAFLRALAAAGGGSLITQPGAAWLDNLAGAYAQRSLSTWLWLLALLLLPVDIGVRRLVVSRRDLAGIRAALFARRVAGPAVEPAVAPLRAVRARRAERPGRLSTPSRTAPVPDEPRAADGAAGVPTSRKEQATSVPPPEKAAAAGAQEDTTTGRLLAAKRRAK